MLKMIKNFTLTQWIILGISTAAFLNASTAQLTEWFGPKITHNIITAIAFVQGLVGTWAVALTSQTATIKQVLAMPGSEKLEVNELANSDMAKLAVDKTINKIAPTVSAMDAVTATAKAS